MRILIFAFVFFIAGTFLLLNISPFEFLKFFTRKKERSDLSSVIKAAKKKKTKKGLEKLIADTRVALMITGKEDSFRTVIVFSLIVSAGGFLVAVIFNNWFLAPVLAVFGALLPFYYVIYTSNRFDKAVTAELETALSIITTSYMRGRNTFINAVEENINYLNPPVSNIFANFLARTKTISSNTKEALEEMKEGINNVVFDEWVDAVILTLDNQNLKPTLPPIVAKLSDIRVVSSELEIMIMPVMKEFRFLVCAEISLVPIFFFLNKDWYEILMFSQIGKGLWAVAISLTLIAIVRTIKNNRPLDYTK